MVRRPAFPRADHLLPTIFGMVNHRAAVAQDSDALLNQALHHIPPVRQAFIPAPCARMQKDVSERHRTRLLKLNRESALSVIRVWSECKIHPLPLGVANSETFLRIDPPVLTVFQGDKEFRRFRGPNADVAFVRLAGNEVQTPPVQALVLDAQLPVPTVESNALALNSHERFFCFDRKGALRGPCADCPPHAADVFQAAVGLRFKRKPTDYVLVLDPKISKPCIALPGAQA